MPKFGRYVSSTAIAGAAFAGLVAIALAATVIEEREELMEANGDAMKALSAIAKNEAPFDAAVIQANAQDIADNLTQAKDLFPEGSHEGDTRALPAIWDNKDDFNSHFDQAIEAAENLAQVTEQADFLPALAAVGDGCKGCHEDYRRPED